MRRRRMPAIIGIFSKQVSRAYNDTQTYEQQHRPKDNLVAEKDRADVARGLLGLLGGDPVQQPVGEAETQPEGNGYEQAL